LEKLEVINDGEAWLFKFPNKHLTELEKLSASQIVHFAMKWAETEELAGWKISDTAYTLSAMVDLAKQASSKSKSLYLCGSV